MTHPFDVLDLNSMHVEALAALSRFERPLTFADCRHWGMKQKEMNLMVQAGWATEHKGERRDGRASQATFTITDEGLRVLRELTNALRKEAQV